MRPIDFAPLYRSTVGFDRLFDLFDHVSGLDQTPATYPPYNIERLGENEYRITMAVAGFGQDEIKVDVKEQALNISGAKKAE
jgi:molecular chaperone IbpA